MLARRAEDFVADASSSGERERVSTRLQRPALDIPESLPSLSSCRTPEDLRDWLLQFARGLGFYGARYVHIGCLWRDYASEAMQPPRRYLTTSRREEDLVEVLACDPCVEKTVSAFAPFTWSTRTHGCLTVRQRAWLEAEGARGVSAGAAVPVQDSMEGPAYLSFFGKGEGMVADFVAEHAPELAFVGAQFHALAKILIPVNSAPRLTPRENECLRLAALGRTIAETGDALGVSSRTVEFHLANASRKLGADTKLRAVVLAIGNGLAQIP